MARPRKTGLDYFPHDCHALDDDKLSVLMAEFGNDAYVWWFGLLEWLYAGGRPFFPLQDRFTVASLARKSRVSEPRWRKILCRAALLGMVVSSPESVTSPNIVATLSSATAERDRKRELRGGLSPTNTGTNHGQTTSQTQGQTPAVSVTKERKVKEIKGITPLSPCGDSSPSTPSKPARSEVLDLDNQPTGVMLSEPERAKLIEAFGLPGFQDRAMNLSLYMRSKGVRYKSHYATLLHWERMESKRRPLPGGNGPQRFEAAGRGPPGNGSAANDVMRNEIAEIRAAADAQVMREHPELFPEAAKTQDVVHDATVA